VAVSAPSVVISAPLVVHQSLVSRPSVAIGAGRPHGHRGTFPAIPLPHYFVMRGE
jgi:hypothetical protein